MGYNHFVDRRGRKLAVLVLVLICIAVTVRILNDNPVNEVQISGESLSVTRDEILTRWTPVENTEQTEMGAYLEKSGEYLEVLCAPSGPFQFTGESLTLPEGTFARGDSRASIREVLGQPHHVSTVPHLGPNFSADSYDRKNIFGWSIASIGFTYKGDQLLSCTAWREDRRQEFQDVHGHMFGELPPNYEAR